MKKLGRTILFLFAAVAMICFFATETAPAAAKSDSQPSVKINKKNIDVDIKAPFTVKVKTKDLSENCWLGYTIDKQNSSGDYEYYSNYTCEEKKNGKYIFTIYDSGTYRLNFSAVEDYGDWYWDTYEDSCIINVRNIGPEKREFALLVDSSQKINIDRGEFVSAEIVATKTEDDPFEYSPEDEWDRDDWFFGDWGFDDGSWSNDFYTDDTYSSSHQGEVSVNGDTIKAVKEGRATVKVVWKNEAGEEITENLTVDVTDPVYAPYEGYYLANSSYIYPSLSHKSEFSEIKLSTDNEKVCTVSYGAFNPVGFGTCKLTIVIDGKEFTDTINVYDPKLSDEMMLIKKKKTTVLTVSGLPEGIPVSYTSGDSKIVSVDSTGNIKAKKLGNTYISVHCEGLCDLTCSVTVGNGKKGMKAALQAKKYVGSEYSQEKRMQDGYFDCSSLAWRSYKDSGTAIGGSDTYAPTAADLGKYYDEAGKTIATEFVSPDELKPGDLIFYSTTNNGRFLNIDHVAVYYGANYGNVSSWYGDYGLENSGAIVHSRTGGVQLDNYSGYVPGGIVLICRP
ncbi:MAG: Ig-like domain-containing protein [Lachnospiraceae bacterium]|nr:Ig-like domain-containing protein [Lachnospiraceae bacterium]